MPPSTRTFDLNKNYDDVLGQTDVKESELNVLFRDSPIATAFCDLAGIFMRTNSAYCSLVGYASAELEGVRTFGSITHPDDLDADKQMVSEVVAGKRNHYGMQKRYITKLGKTIWVDMTVNKVTDKEQVIVHLVAVVIPIVLGDEYLKLRQDADGSMSLRPFIPVGQFLWEHRKYVLGLCSTVFVFVGGTLSMYYKAVTTSDIQAQHISEVLRLAEERKQLIETQQKQLSHIQGELIDLRRKLEK